MDMSSIRTGLTSVTFRALSISKIVQLAAAAGLDGIEWGGDIHVPAGDIQSAVFALQETEKAGLEVLSYGSYYHGLPEEDFSPVLESAKALQAPMIRVWAGNRPFEDCPEEIFQQLVLAFRHAADLAKPFGIDISFEYHRGTLTQTKRILLLAAQPGYFPGRTALRAGRSGLFRLQPPCVLLDGEQRAPSSF